MDISNRPCAPHLQIYKLPLTARLSISHRVTGVLLSLGFVLLAVALVLISAGPASCSALQRLLAATPAKIGLGVFLYALFFHWCHGLRHLFMDAGASLEKYTLRRYAWLEIILSTVLTLAAAAFIWVE